MTDVITPEAPDEPTATEPTVESTSTPITKEIKRQIQVCRQDREELIDDWTDSREYHKGRPFSTESDADRMYVNKDWPRVKARVSSLFGQMPEVRLLPKNMTFAPSVPVFAKELNDTLKRADVDEAIFQALVDHTATSGFGVVMVNYQKRTETVDMPTEDISQLPPDQQLMMLQSGVVKIEPVETTTDALFTTLRLSPTDLLWPTEFTGFNFDKADWIGRTGEMVWSEAQTEFGLLDDQKEKVLGEGKEDSQTLKQSDDTQNTRDAGQPKVEFDEVFYWAYRFDPAEKYFKKIRRIVFVKGLPDPVVHEDWAGQQFNEMSGSYVGACRFPIRVLKINYVSDDAIPPSESYIGRPQVVELNESRTYQHLHRKRTPPVGWINTNKFDADILVNLMQGNTPRWVPVNGRGEDAMGELNRVQYPAEFQMFDRTVNQDLDEIYQQGANQQGAFASGERSASEARIVQQNFDMRNGLDRAHVAKFVQGIAEVMAGLLALYGEFEISTEEELQRLAGWDRTQIAGEFVYEVIPDSMIRLDAHQQIGLLMDILNMTAKSGFVNPAGIIGKILSLAGEDPAAIMVQPNPPAPEPLNISVRSAEDLRDPLMLGLLMRTDQAPTPQHLEAAQNLLMAAGMPPTLQPLQPDGEGEAKGAAPPNSATSPEGMAVVEKINKRSDFV